MADAYVKSAPVWVAALLVALGAVVACDDRESAIRTYSAPKDAVLSATTVPATSRSSAIPSAPASLPLTWTLPAGWQQDPQPRPMRVATVHIDFEGKHGELIVTRFRTGGFGSLVDNLNRWRQQVGLEPVADESAVTPEKTTVGGAQAKVYDFTGQASDGNPARRNRVVMVETPAGDAWFFRLHGPADLVEAQRGAFDSLLQSVKFDSRG